MDVQIEGFGATLTNGLVAAEHHRRLFVQLGIEGIETCRQVADGLIHGIGACLGKFHDVLTVDVGLGVFIDRLTNRTRRAAPCPGIDLASLERGILYIDRRDVHRYVGSSSQGRAHGRIECLGLCGDIVLSSGILDERLGRSDG